MIFSCHTWNIMHCDYHNGCVISQKCDYCAFFHDFTQQHKTRGAQELIAMDSMPLSPRAPTPEQVDRDDRSSPTVELRSPGSSFCWGPELQGSTSPSCHGGCSRVRDNRVIRAFSPVGCVSFWLPCKGLCSRCSFARMPSPSPTRRSACPLSILPSPLPPPPSPCS